MNAVKNGEATETVCERTIGKYLVKHGFRRLSVRPEHPKTDAAAQEVFKKTLPAW